jgi:hypothetical protein
MKRSYVVPDILDSVVAVEWVSDTANEVAFDFAAPKWDFLRHHLRSPAHPSWFSFMTFAAVWRGLAADDNVASGLASSRVSCDRRVAVGAPVECSRVLVRWEEVEGPWRTCFLDVGDARGNVWAKAELKAKLLGSKADFAQRRRAAKARVLAEVAESKQVAGIVSSTPKWSSRVVLSRRMAMEEHPYYGGSGDHVNTGMQADLFLQFATSVCRAVLGIAADSFVTVASSMEMLRFVEFDVEMAFELVGTSCAKVSNRSFADASAFEVAREWSDVEGELRVVRAQLLQQDRVCSLFESVLLPIVKPKL